MRIRLAFWRLALIFGNESNLMPDDPKSDYKSTLNLTDTPFPMRGDPGAQGARLDS